MFTVDGGDDQGHLSPPPSAARREGSAAGAARTARCYAHPPSPGYGSGSPRKHPIVCAGRPGRRRAPSVGRRCQTSSTRTGSPWSLSPSRSRSRWSCIPRVPTSARWSGPSAPGSPRSSRQLWAEVIGTLERALGVPRGHVGCGGILKANGRAPRRIVTLAGETDIRARATPQLVADATMSLGPWGATPRRTPSGQHEGGRYRPHRLPRRSGGHHVGAVDSRHTAARGTSLLSRGEDTVEDARPIAGDQPPSRPGAPAGAGAIVTGRRCGSCLRAGPLPRAHRPTRESRPATGPRPISGRSTSCRTGRR